MKRWRLSVPNSPVPRPQVSKFERKAGVRKQSGILSDLHGEPQRRQLVAQHLGGGHLGAVAEAGAQHVQKDRLPGDGCRRCVRGGGRAARPPLTFPGRVASIE